LDKEESHGKEIPESRNRIGTVDFPGDYKAWLGERLDAYSIEHLDL
jgi:hypothetical protein